MKYRFCLFALLILLCGCTDSKYVSEEHIYNKEKYDSTGVSLCISVNVKYITLIRGNLNPKINEDILKYAFLGYDSGDSMSSAMYSAWENEQKNQDTCTDEHVNEDQSTEDEDIYVATPWYYNCSVENVSDREDKVSLVMKYSTNAPFVNTVSPIYITLNPQTGERVRISDVFNDTISLQNVITDMFIKGNNLQDGVPLTEQGLGISVDILPLTDDFVFTEQGVIFYYPMDQLAPLAQCKEEINVPFELLEGLLK